MRKWAAILLALTLTLQFFGCVNVSPSGERILVDGEKRKVSVPDKVESIVCVGVGALRYTCYLRCADLVVGVEDYEKERSLSRLYNYVNFDQLQDLPVIGTNGKPNAEEIIRVSPQVIVLSAYAGVAADELQSRTGIPVVVIPGSDAVLDDKAFETIRILAELLGKERHGENLTQFLRQMKQDLSKGAHSSAPEDLPTVYIGGVSYKGLHGFEGTEAGYGPLELIGANNLADTAGHTGAFNIDLEQVLSWNPDVIFLDYEGMALINDHYARNPGYYESMTALQQGRVYAQLPFRSYAANLETALANAYYAATVLYPEQFGEVDLEARIGEIFTMLLGANPYADLKEAGYVFRPITIGK